MIRKSAIALLAAAVAFAAVTVNFRHPCAMAASGQPASAIDSKRPVPQYRLTGSYRLKPIGNSADGKAVLLTFDDGPKDESMIRELLRILDKHGAKAIFFVNGYRAKRHPELIGLLHARGQTIGNHAWDHLDLSKASEAEADRQIAEVQRLIGELAGKAPRFFRPPFGAGGERIKRLAKRRGLLYMTWSIGSLDWEKRNRNKPERVVRNVMDQLHPGANILMHELPWTVEALDTLLTRLEEAGYGFIDPSGIDTGATDAAERSTNR
ncbi:hypothetical protein PACILC2_02880 [Paenibacillus cisolokensis]|uniref:NodB homology domain-containing protein n=1 Tax=Paenibacillus cisolokensis TaxID=1658519 RepID=A0ABQ4N0L1_9BACL|nr:polysaccharide deacetylase family protein [Paenibacillus cisolokensis]GIQ61720.1 hypothetical protein PACILC2_02880 [Paenibacillus cisolokensis]